jgi:hypothetical protein
MSVAVAKKRAGAKNIPVYQMNSRVALVVDTQPFTDEEYSALSPDARKLLHLSTRTIRARLDEGVVDFKYFAVIKRRIRRATGTRNTALFTYTFKGGRGPRKFGLLPYWDFTVARVNGSQWRSFYIKNLRVDRQDAVTRDDVARDVPALFPDAPRRRRPVGAVPPARGQVARVVLGGEVDAAGNVATIQATRLALSSSADAVNVPAQTITLSNASNMPRIDTLVYDKGEEGLEIVQGQARREPQPRQIKDRNQYIVAYVLVYKDEEGETESDIIRADAFPGAPSIEDFDVPL